MNTFIFDNFTKVMFAYSKLKPLQRTIFEYLYTHDGFIGDYTDLTICLGQQPKNNSNIRKALIILENAHVIRINRTNKIHMTSMMIADGWDIAIYRLVKRGE